MKCTNCKKNCKRAYLLNSNDVLCSKKCLLQYSLLMTERIGYKFTEKEAYEYDNGVKENQSLIKE